MNLPKKIEEELNKILWDNIDWNSLNKPERPMKIKVQEDIKQFLAKTLQEERQRIKEEVEKYFHSKCIVNKFNECKYWNRDKDNESFADEKFFPEELKDDIINIINQK